MSSAYNCSTGLERAGSASGPVGAIWDQSHMVSAGAQPEASSSVLSVDNRSTEQT